MKALWKYMCALALLCSGTALSAQKGNIGFVYPAGACRGTTVEVTVGGQGLGKATDILFSGKGISATLLPRPEGQPRRRKSRNIGEEDNLQLADVVRFRVTVDKNAELGMRDVRLVLPNGLTNRLYFEVGQLPDVAERPDRELSGVSSTLPVTFNGQIMRADTDRFRFRAEAGMQLVIALKGRVFVPYMADAVPGWFQPVMHLYDESGREVAFSDDYTFHVDPVIFYKVPQSGNYEIKVYDGLFRGREDFVYRIDVGELPFVTSVYPLGGRSRVSNRVEVKGYNLSSQKAKVRPATEGRIPFTVKGKGGLRSNTVLFSADTCNTLSERAVAGNDSRGSAVRVQPFDACNGRITEPLQERWYCFTPPKTRSWHFEVVARRAGSPADLRMTLFNASGDQLAAVDDVEDISDYMATHHADPQLNRKLTGGQTVWIRLTEAQGHAGEDYAYRFFVTPSQPDFSLNIEPSTFSVPESGTGMFNVIASRKSGMNAAIDLELEGLPPGFKVSGARLERGMTKTIVTVTAPEGAAHKTWMPVLTGRALVGKREIVRTGHPVETMMQAFYYRHLMPIEDFRMEVGEALSFSVTPLVPEQPLRLTREGNAKTPLTVRVDRRNGFDQPVTLMLRSSSGGLKTEAVVVPGDQTEAVIEIELRGKNWRDRLSQVVVYGVVKGKAARVAGQGRNAYVAAATAYAPTFQVLMPGTGIKPEPKAKKK